jgi:hypothetical protein
MTAKVFVVLFSVADLCLGASNITSMTALHRLATPATVFDAARRSDGFVWRSKLISIRALQI